MFFLSAASRAALEKLLEGDSAPDSPAPLERIRAIRRVLAELEGDPAALASVRDALDDGETWNAISEAAGLKPAAAKWRWQGSDEEIAERHEAGRKRSARPSSVPTDLPGYSVSEAARILGVTPQAVYLRITRGQLRAESVSLPDGRTYKRVFFDDSAPDDSAPAES